MNLKYRAIAATAVLGVFACSGIAATVTSTFDTDLEGWATNSQGVITYSSTGGNPGGYLDANDDGNGNIHAAAPAKFLGNLLGFTNLSVDILLYSVPANPSTAFGVLTFTNSSAAFLRVDLGDPSTAIWTHYSTALNAAAFGVSAADYAAVMGDVTSLTLILDSDKNATNERAGMDNFTLSSDGGEAASVVATPEPGTIALLGIGLACLVSGRKRRKS